MVLYTEAFLMPDSGCTGEAAEYAQQAVKAIQAALGKDHPALVSFWEAVANLREKVSDCATVDTNVHPVGESVSERFCEG